MLDLKKNRARAGLIEILERLEVDGEDLVGIVESDERFRGLRGCSSVSEMLLVAGRLAAHLSSGV